jgi:hypothetical protein
LDGTTRPTFEAEWIPPPAPILSLPKADPSFVDLLSTLHQIQDPPEYPSKKKSAGANNPNNNNNQVAGVTIPEVPHDGSFPFPLGPSLAWPGSYNPDPRDNIEEKFKINDWTPKGFAFTKDEKPTGSLKGDDPDHVVMGFAQGSVSVLLSVLFVLLFGVFFFHFVDTFRLISFIYFSLHLFLL